MSLRVVGAAVVVFLVGCGGEAAAPSAFDTDHSNMTPEEGRAFADFPLYYLGDEFEGHELTAMNRRLSEPPPGGPPSGVNYVSFIYGTCEPSSDAGCAPPFEVQVSPICERNPSSYSLTPDPDGPGPQKAEPLPSDPTRIRGAPAAFYWSGDHLEIYTERVTITIFGGGREDVRRAAATLRPLNASAAVAPDGSLPPADARVLQEGC